ncbi:MAG: 50S ribosomal protein L6 [Bacteroidales bacterium]
MSRIGKSPITLPAGVTFKVEPGNVVRVKGALGELTQKVDPDIEISVDGDSISFTRPTNQPRHRSLHGLYRSLVNNMVVGVSTGYKVRLEFVGVGFKVEVKGNLLVMSLGFSHDLYFMLPDEVKAEAEQVRKGQPPILSLSCHDKQLLGSVVAKLRSLRKIEPYKGKGIKFVGESVRRKAGKSASAK